MTKGQDCSLYVPNFILVTYNDFKRWAKYYSKVLLDSTLPQNGYGVFLIVKS